MVNGMKYGKCCLLLTIVYTYIIVIELFAQLTISGKLNLQVVVEKVI